MIKNWYIKQDNLNDCGIACLCMILRYYDKNISYEKLKDEFRISKEGISCYDIVKISKKYDINAFPYKNYSINKVDKPLIVHTINSDNIQHFVIIERSMKNKLKIIDPYKGCYIVSKEKFKKRYTGVAITFNQKDNLPIKDIFKNKKVIFQISLFTLVWSLFCVIYSYSLSLSIGYLNENYFSYMLILIIFIGLIKELLSFFRNKLSLAFQMFIDKMLTIPTLKKFFNLPLKFYNTHPSGELLSKINDLSYIKEMVTKMVEVLFVNLILIIICLIIVSSYSLLYSLLFIFLFVMLYLYNYLFFKKQYIHNYNLQIKNERLNNKIINSLNNIVVIKNHFKENFFINKCLLKYNLLLESYKEISNKYILKNFINNVIEIVVDVLSIYIGIHIKLNVESFIFIIMIEGLIVGALNNIYDMYPLFINYKSSLNRINSIYKEKEIDKKDKSLIVNNIEYKNLSFKLENKIILKNISIKIKKGDFIHITGNSGSGKSTMFKLLNKEYYTNQIYINNKNIRDIYYKSLKDNILYVDQKFRLFNDTIEDNIMLDKNIDKKALDTSLVNQFIKKNNLDYKYLIDNTSSNISGGQMQKIIIAQSLCQNKNVIIFDETTCMLDEKEERKILKNIKNNYKDLTIILISHRLSNLDLFNKKYRLDSGYLRKVV